MLVEKNNEYTLLTPDKNSAKLFYNSFVENQQTFKGEHIIIDFSRNLNLSLQELLVYSDFADTYRANNTSFILICAGIDIDAIPDEINLVPTMTEAIDVLQMDAIERDLMDF